MIFSSRYYTICINDKLVFDSCQAQQILDAVRVSDGKKVILKVVDINKDIPILDYLNSPALLADERNHTVPILDKFPVPHEENLTWIVMPFLLMFHAFIHPFRYVSEIIEPVTQFLEVSIMWKGISFPAVDISSCTRALSSCTNTELRIGKTTIRSKHISDRHFA